MYMQCINGHFAPISRRMFQEKTWIKQAYLKTGELILHTFILQICIWWWCGIPSERTSLYRLKDGAHTHGFGPSAITPPTVPQSLHVSVVCYIVFSVRQETSNPAIIGAIRSHNAMFLSSQSKLRLLKCCVSIWAPLVRSVLMFSWDTKGNVCCVP